MSKSLRRPSEQSKFYNKFEAKKPALELGKKTRRRKHAERANKQEARNE